MSIFATIENREKELFVLNNGPLNSPITLVKRMPTLLEFIPGPRPIAGVAKIKGANDLYINVGPVGDDRPAWSWEPCEWKHNIDGRVA
ncbi:hypothetical protein AX14_002322, partial [Amanita brunnescens Koide BX004]